MTDKRFALRIHSPFPLPISITYGGQRSAGEGIVQELSRVGCRILGNGPVEEREALRIQISCPASQPLVIEQAIVKWVKGLEFGLAFKRLVPRDVAALPHLLETLLNGGRSAESLEGEPPAA